MLTLPQLHNNSNAKIRDINLNDLGVQNLDADANAEEVKTMQNFYNTAHTFAFLADLGYQESNLIEWRLDVQEEDRTNKNFIYFDDGSRTQGYIIKEEKDDAINIIVVFRGTEYEKFRGFYDDWRSDFLSFFTTIPDAPKAHFDDEGVKVHQGFWENLNSVWNDDYIQDIANLLKEKQNNKTVKVWFTGHSLGAALATLAAARWAQKFGNEMLGGVYTFGSPMCGNDEFVKYYDQTLGLADITFRFVNHRDIVPRAMTIMNAFHPLNTAKHMRNRIAEYLPILEHTPIISRFFKSVPSSIYQQHVGKLYYFDDQGKIGCDAHGKIADAVTWLPEVKLSTLNPLEFALDHDHREYLKHIEDLSGNKDDLFFKFVGYQNGNRESCNVM